MDELMTEAKLEKMDAVLDFVNAHLADCPLKVQNQIAIAVDEIFANIARYAYHPDVGSVTVRISVGDAVTIEFEDRGAAYDPLAREAPDISSPAEARPIGGLGIFMVRNLMDSVEYRREGYRNILTIKKELPYNAWR